MAGRVAKYKQSLPVLPLRDIVQLPGAVNTVLIVRPHSHRAVEAAVEGARQVFAVSIRESQSGESDALRPNFHGNGTVSEILQWFQNPNGTARVVLKGLWAASAGTIEEKAGLYLASIGRQPDIVRSDSKLKALCEEIRQSFARVAVTQELPDDSIEAALAHSEPGELCFAIAQLANFSLAERQALLNERSLHKRLQAVYTWLRREELVSTSRRTIRAATDAKLAESQREFVLRQQMQTIQNELRMNHGSEADRFRETLADRNFSEDLHAHCEKQISQWDALSSESAESAVGAKYLQTLLALPSNSSSQIPDLRAAKQILDDAHYGLEEVKQRVVEYLAVRKLTDAHTSPPLCFVGPPGVGKTSFARAIAECLGRPFASVSLGGIRDEADIRGHRRTYVGAQPGRIVQALIRAGVTDPVCLLDEVDKIAIEGSRSNPASALLELLDRAQSTTFHDHYIDFPLDITGVLFVATANTLDGLPPALVDRLEVVAFPSYTHRERLAIAKQFLLPNALREHGLGADQLIINDLNLERLVKGSSREPGVRGLNRLLGALCRRAAVAIATGSSETFHANSHAIEALIGGNTQEPADEQNMIGVANALVVANYGGDVIRIECSAMAPLSRTPELRLTGSMGEIMRESAETALSLLRSSKLLSSESFKVDIHIHATEANRLKEGPSAGLSIWLALASALNQRALPASTAATGELTLSGQVLPVGGLREKLAAAQRQGIKRVLVPVGNRAEIERMPSDLVEEMEIVAVRNAREAYELVWPTAVRQKN